MFLTTVWVHRTNGSENTGKSLPAHLQDISSHHERTVQTLAQDFVRRFGDVPTIYQAPGRVNLIGEHTDYNEGFVMPAAIGMCTRVAAAPRRDGKLIVRSENFSEEATFELDQLPVRGSGHWSDYVVGVAKVLAESGIPLTGANLLICGDVPVGAGLSSSASVEVAVGYALMDLAGQETDRAQLARLCQQAENEFVGARCGIMDQFVASHGKRDHALLLDCRSLDYRLLPLRADARLVICNTMVRHAIAGGEYNQRRAECEAGVKYLSRHFRSVRALRDATLEELAALSGELPDKILRRCRHVISENARVVQAAAALTRNELSAFGDLMRESHRSLRDDFEVSCAELDLMVQLVEQAQGVYGARMTGGGFGGCTINLVDASCVDAFQQSVSEGYERATGRRPEIYVCSAADGVGLA
ncbi:MAG: galactokinase [Acidobacteriia bacterium]|nr:galactokinase [Terriglobia bacterium]